MTTYIKVPADDGFFVTYTTLCNNPKHVQKYANTFATSFHNQIFLDMEKDKKAAAKWYADRLKEIESQERYTDGLDHHKIDFCADNSQYLRPMLVNGVAPIIGIGKNEAEAYEDALYLADDEYCDRLPETYGNPEHDMAHYFGKDVAKEHAECDGSELHVFCLIYIF